ncbi:MAG: RNA methyltransferase, partial [Caulobacteraceae bacterium]
PLDGARVFERVEDAIADLRLVLATTARPRELQLPVSTPREAAAALAEAVGAGWTAGLLFGGERAGLSSDHVALCQGVVTVPVDARFRSLNLAQAVAICAYEWRLACDAAAPSTFAGVEAPAEAAAMEGLFGQLEGELDAAGFFHPPEKRPSMVRNLRAPLARARFTDQEVRTFRGVVTALSKGRGRVLAKLAAKKGE